MIEKNWINRLPKVNCLPVVCLGQRKLTPEICQQVLEYSKDVNQRKINKGRLQEYVNAMSKNLFQDTGCIIWLNKANKLIDGQHRFLSVIQSGRPRTFMILKLMTDNTDALGLILDRGQPRTLAQIVGETGAFCSAVEFFHRIICNNGIRTTPYETELMIKFFKEKKVDKLVHSISEKYYNSKKMKVQRFARCALITGALLNYDDVEQIWYDLIHRNTTNPVSNMIWNIIDEAVHEWGSTVLPQDIERKFYYKTLLCLKEKKYKSFLLSDTARAELEGFMKPMFCEIF